ncbi:MAG TPA: hypothetical protein VF198_00405 [Vicinamibacterales bacterium]
MITTPATLDGEPARQPEAAEESRARPGDTPGVAADEHLYLTGRPPLRDFIRYVRHQAVDPPGEGTLADEWRAAADVVRALEREEAGVADDPPIDRMGPDYEPLLVEFLASPLVRHGFNTVPTEVAFVELDRLVVWQKHIDLTFVRRLEQKLGPAPDDEAVFRACLLDDRLHPPVRWSRVHRDRWVFTSTSNDLRFLGTMRLEADNIRNYPPPGDLVGIVGIAVGFGSNFVNAIRAENRLILNNGSHRAYALRNLGITRVPCIIQHVSLREELDLIGPAELRRDPDLYLKNPRPPMLKDYFNPKLRRVMPVHRRVRQVTVTFSIDEGHVEAL